MNHLGHRFTRIIPCLLLRGNGLVKTVKFKNATYVGDPLNAVRIFNEREVDELIILDIDASIEERGPNFKKLQEIAGECFMPFGYGGGIKSLEQAKKIFELGAEKVIFNSLLYQNPKVVSEVVKVFGSQGVVASIDVKKNLWGGYEVVTMSGRSKVGKKLEQVVKEAEDNGVGEIILTSVEHEGTMKGMDLSLIHKVTSMTRLPVVAHGGVGEISDFKLAVTEGGASAVAAGSFFIYHGKHRAVLINYPSAEELKKELT